MTPREDEMLLSRLREGLESSDSAPADVAEFARSAFSWRTIDADLAELEFDSIDEELPSGVRSSATARMISFQAGQWMFDVEYDEVTGRLLGQISPQTSYTVELHTTGALFSVDSDSSGRFAAEGIAPGPAYLILRFLDGTSVKTRWVTL